MIDAKEIIEGVKNRALETIIQMHAELIMLKHDERNYYPTANVFSNAPLTLIQIMLSTQINLLEKFLNLPQSKFPLKEEDRPGQTHTVTLNENKES